MPTRHALSDLVLNDLRKAPSGVWLPPEARSIAYSDGAETEAYLRSVMNGSQDLSTTSVELERHIKDWVSEYHLTRKRAQLFSPLEVDHDSAVLEVGCGCGAITRYLGERFANVISVEGSLARAELARLRTRDLNSVDVICSPYQDIKFRRKLNLVYCIGVLEYAGSFVPGDNPYARVLQEFADLTDDDGQLVLAIENQFGLKYFSSAREDHTNRMFEGVEGYPLWGSKVKTFGRSELEHMLKPLFQHVEFLYPYPDYKIPTGVFAERLFDLVDAGELIGQYRGRDYAGRRSPLFDERLATIELARNGQLPFFANSFLVVASKSARRRVKTASLGVMYSGHRRPEYETVTRFLESADHQILVQKQPIREPATRPSASFELRGVEGPWISGPSLQLTMERRLQEQKLSMAEFLAPAGQWVQALREQALDEERRKLPGHLLDAIWRNTFVHQGKVAFIDLEWKWLQPIDLQLIVIRAVYFFLRDLPPAVRKHPLLRQLSTRKLVTDMAAAIGVGLDETNFDAFVLLEAELVSGITGKSVATASAQLRLGVSSDSAYRFGQRIRDQGDDLKAFGARVRRGLRKLVR